MPAINILVDDQVTTRSVAASTGNAFFAVISEKGPTIPVYIKSMDDFEKHFGQRVTWGTGWDSVWQFFQVGGSGCWVIRKTASTAVAASIAQPAVTPIITWSAKSTGAWGNSLAVELKVDPDNAGQFMGVVTRTQSVNGSNVESVVETSPSYLPAAKASLITWFNTTSEYISGVTGTAPLAASPKVSLASGNDAVGSITNQDRTDAFAKFGKDLGPGQLVEPGGTTQSSWDALAVAAMGAADRFAVWELPDAGDLSTMKAAPSYIMTTHGLTGARHGMFVGGAYVIMAGPARGSRVIAYPSVITAALCSINDQTNSPNQAAAGPFGVVRRGIDVTRHFTDDDHEELNEAGVNIFRVVRGQVQLMGFRTAAKKADHPLWYNAANARMLMYLVDGLSRLADKYHFIMIDGGGGVIGRFQGEQIGFLQNNWLDGSLFGAESTDAYFVDVGAQVNTPDTIENGELRSVITLKMSNGAEDITITIIKRLITEEV